MAFSPRDHFARRIAARDASSRLYAILDAETCMRRSLDIATVAEAWFAAGIRLLQYRDKQGSDAEVLAAAERIRRIFCQSDRSILLLNDRVHLVLQAQWDGAHIGQGDMPVADARAQMGAGSILGLSTHRVDEAIAAAEAEVDYVAAGPVFATTTKLDASPVIGLEGLAAIASRVHKPLVAIGGMSAAQAGAVLHAGANSIAAISALLPAHGEGNPQRAAERLLGAVETASL